MLESISPKLVTDNDAEQLPKPTASPLQGTHVTAGTGSGSEVVEIQRVATGLYHFKTKDGAEADVDDSQLDQLPQGRARLATLDARAAAAAKNAAKAVELDPAPVAIQVVSPPQTAQPHAQVQAPEAVVADAPDAAGPANREWTSSNRE